jgi:outer membrane cobalamin receptor
MKIRAMIMMLNIVCVVTPLLAQQHNDSIVALPQVIISAQRLFVKETAGMMDSRIDSVVMLHKSHLSLSDLLSENTPVFIKNHGRGALATASFRGTAASHTLVNWNGLPINSPMAGMVDFSLIPVYIIDDVQLQHGMASVTSRSGGLGGAINIHNKPAWNDAFTIRYMQGLGSYTTLDEFLDVAAGSKKFQSRSRLYHNFSRNNYTFINRGIADIDPVSGLLVYPVDTNRHAAYTRYGFLQEFYQQLGSSNILSVKWWAQWADRSIPRATSYEGPDYANLSKQFDNDHRVVADWNHYTSHAKMTIRTGFTRKDLDYRLDNRVPGLGTVPAIVSESQELASLNHISYSREMGNGLSMETSLDANFLQVESLDSLLDMGYSHQRAEFSLMASTRKSFANRLNINLLIRQDMTDGQMAPPIPFAGFDLRLIKDMNLVIRGHAARNYRMPSLNDLYWQPGGNASLLPEEGFSFELGADYQLLAGSKQLMASASVHKSDINNWIVWIPGFKGYWEPQNIKRVLVKGLEMNMQWGAHAGQLSYKIHATYALNRSINYGDALVWGDASYGKQLVYVPVHSGNMLVSLGYKKYAFSWQHNSYSERFTTSSNNVSQRDKLYPYHMNDVSLERNTDTPKVAISVGIKVYNLFNERYRTVLHRPMPGRNYMLVVRVKV